MDRYYKVLLGIIMIMIIQSYPYFMNQTYYVLGVIGSFVFIMLADELRLTIIEHKHSKDPKKELDKAIKKLEKPIKKKETKTKPAEMSIIPDQPIIIPFSKQSK